MPTPRTRLIAVTSAFGVAATLAIAPVAQAADDTTGPIDTSTTDTPSQVQDINVDVPTTDAAKAATTYLADNKGTYSIDTSEVKVLGTSASQGSETVRLQQTVDGVPVLGAQYLVHMKKNADSTTILSTNGTYQSDLKVDTTADATVAQATASAEAFVQNQLANGKMTAHKPADISSDSKGLVVIPGETASLAYDIQVSTVNPTDGTPVIRDVYVDAGTTWPLFALDAIQTDNNSGAPVVGAGVNAAGKTVPMQLTKNDAGNYIFLDQSKAPSNTEIATFDGRKYEVSQVSGKWPKTLTDIYGGPTSSFSGEATDAGLVDAHVNAGKVYDYYKSLGRDGLDGKGGDITSIAGVTYYHQPYVNAFWDGTKMVYGSGDAEYKVMSSELDVVGHEMTHGVVEHTANLLYVGQSGAMNEGLADYFGNAIDVDDSGMSMSDPQSGLLGEDLCRTLSPEKCAIRDLNDNRTTASYVGLTTDYDNGGVHENSTIFSGALWNIREALGGKKADAIVYKALSEYMTPLDDFVAGRRAVEQAARDMHVSSFGMGAIESAFNKHGIKDNWEHHAGDAKRLFEDLKTQGTGPAAGGGWWVAAQTDPTGSDPYTLYAGRTDGTGTHVVSAPLPDQTAGMPKRFNVLPATDGKNVAWWAWGSTQANLMVAPLDGSAPARVVAGASNPSYLSIDGDWVSWTSPVYGSPKQYYANITKPGSQQPVDDTYYRYSGYGSVNNGRLVYILSWPDIKGDGKLHLNLVARDLATGTEKMLPEFLPKETDPYAGLFAPKALDDKIVAGIDEYAGTTSGIMTLNWDGTGRKTVVDEQSTDAPYLGNYDATDEAVTFESWPGDVPPHIFQVGIDGGTVRPMSCSTGVQYKVNADEGTTAVWLDGSYGDTSLVVRDKPREHC